MVRDPVPLQKPMEPEAFTTRFIATHHRSRFRQIQAACDTAKFAVGSVPRPPHWTGYRIVPMTIEFWEDRPFRLHDRVVFRRERPDQPWTKSRLYP